MARSYDKNKDTVYKVEAFFANEQDKMLAVLKQSIKDMIEDANSTVAEGGRMRVDTGFLRASGVGAINEIPKGESEGRERGEGETGVIYPYKSESLNVILPKLKVGDTFYYGWTAHYAKAREYFDGFLEGAIQKWNQIVENNIRRVKK